MTEIRYCELVQTPDPQLVQGFGTSTNDGWMDLVGLPPSKMPTGARQYAVLVSGKITQQQLVGTGASRGRAEVRLGTRAGTRHPDFFVTVPVRNVCQAGGGIPFQFLFLVTADVADSLFGSSIDLSTNELCLWARTFQNGDPMTYAHEFAVSDVSWLWWDVTSIPTEHRFAHQFATAAAVPTTLPSTWEQVTPTFGAAGEQWLHFSNVDYVPTIVNRQAARFQIGISADGTTSSIESKIGTVRFGQNRTPATLAAEPTFCQQGAWWVHTNAGATTRAGIRGVEQGGASAPSGTTRRRWRHFAVRIDTLLDVHHLRITQQALGVAESEKAIWSTIAATIERPAAGILTEPIVMLQGLNGFVLPQLVAYGARVFENGDATRGLRESVFPEANSAVLEGVAAFGVGRRIFQVLSPAIQWKAVFVGYPGTPLTATNVNDIEFLTFHPVRDPENVTTGPGTAPAPVLLNPGTQAPAPASLPLPPTLPNADPQERGTIERNQIRGVTGYRRGWPMGPRAMRQLSVQWGPIGDDAARDLFTWLQQNRLWRLAPPKSQAMSVLSTSRPEMAAAGHRVWVVRVDVVVLRWTG